MTKSYESGIRPYRLEYIRETTVGTTPTDPAWELFSDNATAFDPSLDPDVSPLEGLGDPYPKDHYAGFEEDSLTVSYHLQEKTSSGNTLLDGSSNPNDAATDGLQRDADNRLQSTHSVVRRIDQSDLDASNTVNGSTSLDTRQYLVGKGGYVSNVTLTGDANEDPTLVMVELEYEFEKVRSYKIDQPASSTTIDVISADANDSGTVTVEDEGANTSEDITISANGTASGTSSFSDIDAVELSAEQAGDITISDGTNDLMVIEGQASYDHGVGDLGVPALGSGSHASAIGQSYENFVGDTVEQPSGTTLADSIVVTEMSIDNDVNANPKSTGPSRALSAGRASPQAEVTIFGEAEHHRKLVDAYTTDSDNLIWTLTGGSIQLDAAQALEAEASEDAGQSFKEVDVTYEGQGVTLT